MSNDERAARFGALIDEHRRIVYKICAAYCPSRDDRDDLAQEIVTQAWRSFERFDGRVAFSTWLYRVALNVAISFQRRERRRPEQVEFDDEALLQTTGETRGDEDLWLLLQFVERLDPLNKALILLYLDGYPHREIAATLGITETNVATKIGRLKQAMRDHFATAQAEQPKEKT